MEVRGGTTTPPPVAGHDKRIGLSLSGGGSRAVAFHLGTLRALEDLKLLDEIDVISGVSGGSVMASLLGYTEAPFANVDRIAVEFLGRGLVRPALKTLLHPARAAPLLWNTAVVALPTLAIDLIAWTANLAASLLPGLRTPSTSSLAFRGPSDAGSRAHMSSQTPSLTWSARRTATRQHAKASPSSSTRANSEPAPRSV